MNTNKLTKDELSDLADLCEAHADQFDYDDDICAKFSDLRDKLVAMIKQEENV